MFSALNEKRVLLAIGMAAVLAIVVVVLEGTATGTLSSLLDKGLLQNAYANDCPIEDFDDGFGGCIHLAWSQDLTVPKD